MLGGQKKTTHSFKKLDSRCKDVVLSPKCPLTIRKGYKSLRDFMIKMVDLDYLNT